MIRTMLYDAGLAVIIGACCVAILHRKIHTGIVGGAALLALAIFTAAAFEYEASNYRLGQVVSAATICIWLGVRFWWRRAKLRKRLLQSVCERCPLHDGDER